MDTIGHIHPLPAETESAIAESAPLHATYRVEELERLRYLALHRKCGVVIGKHGSGKSDLLARLQLELESEGTEASIIRLASLTLDEFPWRMAAEIGCSPPLEASTRQLWANLDDYAHGCRQTGQQRVLLFDQFSTADRGLIPSIERFLTTFEGACSCILAIRPSAAKALGPLIKRHAWLQIHLPRLTEEESSAVVLEQAQSNATDPPSVATEFTHDAVDALVAVGSGRIDRLRRLTELAILAAESEEQPTIDAELIRSLQQELRL